MICGYSCATEPAIRLRLPLTAVALGILSRSVVESWGSGFGLGTLEALAPCQDSPCQPPYVSDLFSLHHQYQMEPVIGSRELQHDVYPRRPQPIMAESLRQRFDACETLRFAATKLCTHTLTSFKLQY